MFLRDLLQPMHLIVLLVVYLLFFGTKKVPQFGKQLGEGLKGIREGLRAGQEDSDIKVKPVDAPVERPMEPRPVLNTEEAVTK